MKIKTTIFWTVLFVLLLTFSSCYYRTAPSEIINISPINDSTVFSDEVIFKWKLGNFANGVSYDFYLGDDLNNLQLIQSNLSSGEYSKDGLDKFKSYFWKITAKNSFGECESNIFSFMVCDEIPKNPSPINYSTSVPTSTALSWECFCPEDSTLTYNIYLSDNNNPSLIKENCSLNSYKPEMLFSGTEYTWKVVAIDGDNKYESEIWSFETIPDPGNTPTKPGTPTPVDLSTDQPTDTILSWECSDPDGDTLKYDVYFGDNANPPLVSNEQTGNDYGPGELNTGTVYYWKIVAKDGRGGVTEGDKWQFETIPDPGNTPPSTPNLTSPTDGSTDNAVDITLEWNCTDPDGDSLVYDLYFGKNTDPQFFTNNINANTFDINDLDKGTKYYWKVLAKDGRGGTTFSPISNFTTEEDPIVVIPEPENPLPTNNSTGVIWDSVTLAWDISGNSDGLYYDIYFGKDEIPGIYRIGHAATEITISNLERDQKYYWQIVVTDEPYSREAIADGSNELLEEIAIVRRDSAAKIGEIWNFTTKKNSPPELVSIYPTDGATNVFITESASWIFTDPDGDTLTYDLYFDNDRNPKNIAVDISISAYSPFMYGMEKYYWKIVAKDNYGGICESNTFEFTTNLIQWQKCLGGSAPDYGYSIQQTSDGGYIVAGYTESNDGNVSGNHGNADYWIVKLNSLGTITWQRCLGGFDDDYAKSIQQTSDGGYIVAGFTESNDENVSENHGDYDYWIVKLNSLGNIIWQKCLGGSSWDEAYSIQQTSDGGYIVAGHTQSNDSGDVSGNNGYRDYWIVKLEDLGNDATITWQKCLGGSDADYAKSIQQTSDGGYIVAGYTESNDSGNVSENHGNRDYWVVKTAPVR